MLYSLDNTNKTLDTWMHLQLNDLFHWDHFSSPMSHVL